MCLGSQETPDLTTPAVPVSTVKEDPKKLKIETTTASQAQKKNRNKLKIAESASGVNTSKTGSGLKL